MQSLKIDSFKKKINIIFEKKNAKTNDETHFE